MNEPSRREFVRDAARVLAAGALAGCGHPRTGAAPGTLLVVDVAGLTQDEQSLVTTENGPDGAPILVVRDGPGAFRVLSMQCTHEGCPLNPPARGRISCPCHGSQFDLSGNVLQGPAVYPLGQYAARYDDGMKRLTIQFGA